MNNQDVNQESGADLDQLECVFIDLTTLEYQFGSSWRMNIKNSNQKRKPVDRRKD
jgi:hypothetical protein